MNGLGKKKERKQTSTKTSAVQSPNKSSEKAKTTPLKKEPDNKKKVDAPQEDPALKEINEEELLKKQAELNKQIQELNEKANFEQTQRGIIIKTKEEDIEKKKVVIEQMEKTNIQLAKEIDTLKIEVNQNFDNIESKEKNELFKEEKKLHEESFQKEIKIKKKELNKLIKANAKLKIQKEEDLQKQNEPNVDINEIINLSEKINTAKEKKKSLEKEKEYLIEIQKAHEKCIKEKENINKKIKDLVSKLLKIKKQNKKKNKSERKKILNIIKSGNITEIYEKLDDEEKIEKKEEIIQDRIDKFWEKNETFLNKNETDTENEDKKKKRKKNYI